MGNFRWVITQIPEQLHRLFADAWPSLKLSDVRSRYPGEYDWHCSLMSLPYLLGLERPPTGIWLDQRKKDNQFTRSRKPRIGLVWAGKSNRDLERYISTRRSMDLENLAPLFCDEFSFISLQPEVGNRDRDLMNKFGIQDISDKLSDFKETATFMKTLDLVISIDTSVIHLAGAMGVNAWVVLPKVTDYRWSGSSLGSAWYPHIKIFRQVEPGDWSVPVQQIASALRQKLGLS